MKLPLPPLHVAMITFNGARYLKPQLKSLAVQTVLPSSLWVSDDGSTDETKQILNSFIDTAPFPVHLITGPKGGAAANMTRLISRMPRGCIATCDQDDIWLPNRLVDVQQWVARSDQYLPSIHVCKRTGFIGRSQNRHGHSFSNALVENHAPGNASTFNPAAAALLKSRVTHLTNPPPFFDWWAYQLVLGAGGDVFNDDRIGVFYRAHEGNTLGPRWNARGIITRARALMNGTYKNWLLNQAQALSSSSTVLVPSHRRILEDFLLSAQTHGPLGPAHRLSPVDQILLHMIWRFPYAKDPTINQTFTLVDQNKGQR